MIMQHFLALGLPQGADWIYIAVIALLFFGADKIPQFARSLGRSMSEFKKAKDEFEREITQEPPRQDPPKPKQPALTAPVVQAEVVSEKERPAMSLEDKSKEEEKVAAKV
jgi:TatA/E family protein of Tat protein translocase